MHLNKILEQIKRHQSPSEAIDKLSTALEKHEGSLLEKGFTILKSELAANMNVIQLMNYTPAAAPAPAA